MQRQIRPAWTLLSCLARQQQQRAQASFLSSCSVLQHAPLQPVAGIAAAGQTHKQQHHRQHWPHWALQQQQLLGSRPFSSSTADEAARRRLLAAQQRRQRERELEEKRAAAAAAAAAGVPEAGTAAAAAPPPPAPPAAAAAGSTALTPATTPPTELQVEAVVGHPALIVGRGIEWGTVLLGFEQATKYTVYDEQGDVVALIAEDITGLGNELQRQLLRTRRSFASTVLSADGSQVVFRVRRPAYLINSHMFIEDPQGAVVGEVRQRWHPWRRKYDLFIGKRQFASIDGGLLAWEFELKDAAGGTLALIDRNFQGFAKEIFTDAGKYVVHFGHSPEAAAELAGRTLQLRSGQPDVNVTPLAQARTDVAVIPSVTGNQLVVAHPLPLPERLIALAAAISVDYNFFSQHSAGSGWVTPPLFMPLPSPSGGVGGVGTAPASGAEAAAGAAAAGEAGAAASSASAAADLGSSSSSGVGVADLPPPPPSGFGSEEAAGFSGPGDSESFRWDDGGSGSGGAADGEAGWGGLLGGGEPGGGGGDGEGSGGLWGLLVGIWALLFGE